MYSHGKRIQPERYLPYSGTVGWRPRPSRSARYDDVSGGSGRQPSTRLRNCVGNCIDRLWSEPRARITILERVLLPS